MLGRIHLLFTSTLVSQENFQHPICKVESMHRNLTQIKKRVQKHIGKTSREPCRCLLLPSETVHDKLDATAALCSLYITSTGQRDRKVKTITRIGGRKKRLSLIFAYVILNRAAIQTVRLLPMKAYSKAHYYFRILS